ncbi:MAG TPA: ABC transporter substrate-binding protein [Geminicoccaceae bacterium]|nr:ABC transporter substrate-binding protein [Geminicoccaceae bacterium]
MKRNTAIGIAAALAVFLGMHTAFADGVLKIGRNADSTTFDPIKTIQNVDIWLLNNTNAFLVQPNAEANEIVPDLAESWEISDDGLTYTFHLRDAKFSDGSPVTAQDAVFSLTRVRDDPESVQSAVYQIMKSIEAPDDRTVVVTLSQPSAPFLATLAMFAAAVVPEHAVTELGEQFSEQPVGAGAFRLAEWRRGDMVRLERNEHYWQEGLPKLDAVEWYVVADDNTRILKVEAGELDAAISMPFNRVKDLEANTDINVHLDPSTREDHLLLNHENEWLGNKNVRKALSMAIDLQAIVDTVTFGYGTPANSYIPEGAMCYNPDNPLSPYDPERAKAMLEAEGADGITLTHIVGAGNKVQEQIGVLLKDQLAKVGIDLQLQKVDPGQIWDMFVAGDYEMSMAYWTNDIIDPDQKSTFSLGMDENLNYYTRYDNQHVADLVTQARVELDPEKRCDIYREIQAIAKDDVNWIDLYYSPFTNISRTNVHDFVQNPLGKFLLETTWVDE